MNKVKVNGIYKHFKGDMYLVVAIAKDSDTLEDVVIYKGLYNGTPLWTRSIESFMAEVDHKKYPNVKQKYRFQLQNIKSVREKSK